MKHLIVALISVGFLFSNSASADDVNFVCGEHSITLTIFKTAEGLKSTGITLDNTRYADNTDIIRKVENKKLLTSAYGLNEKMDEIVMLTTTEENITTAMLLNSQGDKVKWRTPCRQI